MSVKAIIIQVQSLYTVADGLGWRVEKGTASIIASEIIAVCPSGDGTHVALRGGVQILAASPSADEITRMWLHGGGVELLPGIEAKEEPPPSAKAAKS